MPVTPAISLKITPNFAIGTYDIQWSKGMSLFSVLFFQLIRGLTSLSGRNSLASNLVPLNGARKI